MSDTVIVSATELRALTQDIIRAKSALDECDEKVECAEAKLTQLQQEQGQRRTELGALLVKAKPLVPKGTWGAYLEKAGLEKQLTFECMSLAGHREDVPDEDVRATADAASRPVADAPAKTRPIVVRLEINEARRSALTRCASVLQREGDPECEAGALILMRMLKGESL